MSPSCGADACVCLAGEVEAVAVPFAVIARLSGVVYALAWKWETGLVHTLVGRGLRRGLRTRSHPERAGKRASRAVQCAIHSLISIAATRRPLIYAPSSCPLSNDLERLPDGMYPVVSVRDDRLFLPFARIRKSAVGRHVPGDNDLTASFRQCLAFPSSDGHASPLPHVCSSPLCPGVYCPLCQRVHVQPESTLHCDGQEDVMDLDIHE